MAMCSRQGGGVIASGVFALVLVAVTASGQDVLPEARYRTASELPVGTTVAALQSQRRAFRYRLDAVQAEIGRLNLALDAKWSGLRALDEQVIQSHLNMLAAEHLVYEAQRRGLPDVLDRQARAADRRREWERLETQYRSRVEGDASGLLDQLTRSRALSADLVVDWNLANDRLRLLESPPVSPR